MYNFNVAVTGLNATDNPAPGVGIARSIRKDSSWSGKIIGLAYDVLDTGIYDSDIFDEVYLVPYPTDGGGSLLHRLKQIKQKVDIDVLMPTLDSELINFHRISNELKEENIKMFMPDETLIKLRSKVDLSKFCKKNNFNSPESVLINQTSQIISAGRKLGWPLILKGIFYEAYLANSQEEACVIFEKINARWGLPIIVQKYMLGEEYDVACLGDGEGNCICAMPMRKLRITEKGKAWAGISIKDEKLLELSKKLISSLKWKGPCEFEFLKSSAGGQYCLVEINPRVPSWIYLAALAGQNIPYLTALLAYGEKIEPVNSYKVGLTFVRHAQDLICPINYIEDLTVKGELVFENYKEGFLWKI